MTWQRALRIIRDHGFRDRDVADRLGVNDSAVEWWWMYARGKRKRATYEITKPGAMNRRKLIRWALGLLAGKEPARVKLGRRPHMMICVVGGPESGRYSVDREKVRARRHGLGLTQIAVALRLGRILGVRPGSTHLCRRHEQRRPEAATLEELFALAEALECEYRDLLP